MAFMNTSLFISNLIAQKGEGFYCILNEKDEITEVFKLTINTYGNEVVQVIGNCGKYSPKDIIHMIEEEGAGSRFVFLSDIISIPTPTDQEIAQIWCEAPLSLEGKVIPFETNQQNSESAPDLIGRENMDFTM